jgi:hypothetical protein
MHLCTSVSEGGDREGAGEGRDAKAVASPLELLSLDTHRREVAGAHGAKGESRNVTHRNTKVNPPKYEQACSTLDTVAAGAQVSPKQPRSNRDLKYLKYCTLQQLARGGHPQPCSTIHYGQVQKRQWTQLPNAREAVGWSTTPARDGTC